MKFLNLFKLFFLTLILCLVTNQVLAGDQLSQLLNNLQTFRADFTQTVMNARGQVLQQVSGKMTIQRPGRFRWEVIRPSRQLLIADGQRIWFYDIDLQQITIQKQKSVDADSPAALLSDSPKNLTQQFIINPLMNVQGFTLFPKNKNALFQSITLIFQKNYLREMRLIDKLDQQTVINFSKIELNPHLSSQTFHFIMPSDKNIEVVKG
ncbi:MAG: outer membrane lipoprotein chaperone LolA [Candidatus Rickettsiella isopodorum]|jgi:outer membrane lipoprotein carrier protein|nr:outer membrane lipoprotein chaperone LolA [Gammaproteobacteria bacterium]MCH9754842.1 outer membrane lipoprotein chaperone LolA [Gammaproteobacteria bacterium]MDD5161453.1 outer membrane lipoprotein chaperone LolA [Candidatus Rickettsiella isopodorum]